MEEPTAISAREFFSAASKTLNEVEVLGRSFIITRSGRPSAWLSRVPREFRRLRPAHNPGVELEGASATNGRDIDVAELTDAELAVLRAVRDRRIYDHFNEVGPSGISATMSAVGGLWLQGLLEQTSGGVYVLTELGERAVRSADAATLAGDAG